MELKEGYKQTELGIIPEDWEVKELRNYFSYISYGFTNPMPTVSSGIYMITANDIKNGIINFKTARKTSFDAYRNLITDKSRPKPNDILLTKDGTLGRLAIVGNEKICINQSVAVIRPNEKVYPVFLKRLLESSYYQKTMLLNAKGSTIKHIYITIVDKMKMGIPSTIEEQKVIAKVLSDTDNLIQAIEKKHSKKRAIKQGAMQQLLTPKEDWEVKALGTIANFYNGKAHEQFIDNNGDYKVVNSKFVSTSGKVYKSANVNICPLKKGDITMVMSDIPNGKALAKCFIVPIDNKYTLNQRICAIRTEEVDTEFLYFILNRNKYYLAFDSGTGQTNLKKNDVLECPIPLPKTKQEQTEIANILVDMNEEIAQLEQKLSKYKMLKQGLMQNLLTGKIRLV